MINITICKQVALATLLFMALSITNVPNEGTYGCGGGERGFGGRKRYGLSPKESSTPDQLVGGRGVIIPLSLHKYLYKV